MQQSSPPHFRRNVAALLIDASGFGAGVSFIQPATVLPALARQLTASQPLVGLVMTAWNGAWLLPQMLAGRWLSDKPRKKPYLLAMAVMGRPFVLVMALALAFGNHLTPAALLFALFAVSLIFRGTDAVAAVAWFDIMSGAVPPARRGRVLGASQMLVGLFGMGAAAFMRWSLGTQGPSFPHNYALLFGLAAVGLTASLIGLFSLAELPGDLDTSGNGAKSVLDHARHVVGHDHAFRMLTAARMLSGLSGLAWPFYVLHATRVLGLPDSTIGFFVATQAVTGVLTSIVTGWVSERYGSVKVILVSALAAVAAPALAMVLHFIPLSITPRTIGYLGVYSLLSIVDYSFLLGYLNYVLEIAPRGQRPAYMGLTNTLGGVLVVLPTLGGWLLENTSYPVLFGITTLGTLAGLVVSWRLPPSNEPVQPPSLSA